MRNALLLVLPKPFGINIVLLILLLSRNKINNQNTYN